MKDIWWRSWATGLVVHLLVASVTAATGAEIVNAAGDICKADFDAAAQRAVEFLFQERERRFGTRQQRGQQVALEPPQNETHLPLWIDVGTYNHSDALDSWTVLYGDAVDTTAEEAKLQIDADSHERRRAVSRPFVLAFEAMRSVFERHTPWRDEKRFFHLFNQAVTYFPPTEREQGNRTGGSERRVLDTAGTAGSVNSGSTSNAGRGKYVTFAHTWDQLAALDPVGDVTTKFVGEDLLRRAERGLIDFEERGQGVDVEQNAARVVLSCPMDMLFRSIFERWSRVKRQQKAGGDHGREHPEDFVLRIELLKTDAQGADHQILREMLRAVEEINGELFEQSQAQSTIASGPEPAPAGQQISRLRIEVDYIFLETQDIHHSQYWAMNNLTAQRSWPNRLNPTQRFLERNSFSLRYCEVNKEGSREVNCLFARAGLPTICVTGRPQPQKPFSRPYVRFQEPWRCEDNKIKNEQQEVEQRLFCDACKMDRHLALLHTVPFAAPTLEATTAGAGGGAASSNDTSRLALWQSRYLHPTAQDDVRGSPICYVATERREFYSVTIRPNGNPKFLKWVGGRGD